MISIELENLAKKLVAAGLSAQEIRDVAVQHLTKEELTSLWSIPRQNIHEFVTNCFASFNLKPPFLDLGCGRRSYKPEAIKRFGADISYIALDHHLPDDQANPERLPNLLADACYLPLPSSTINTVICTELLEHIEDDNLVVVEISRVIKKGGILILTLPGIHIPKHERLPYQIDYRRYTQESITTLLVKNGFDTLFFEKRSLFNLEINLLITAQKTK